MTSDPTPITGQELEEMKRRCDAATEGPWTAEHRHEEDRIVQPDDCYGIMLMGPHREVIVENFPWEGGGFEIGSDAIFAAHARNDLPRCIAEIERLRAVLREINDLDCECSGGEGCLCVYKACELAEQALSS